MRKNFTLLLRNIIYEQRNYKSIAKAISNKLNLKFCTLMYKMGYIIFYKKINKKFIIIYLKYYKNRPIFQILQSYLSNINRINCKVKEMYNKYYTFIFYILSTDKGLFTLDQSKIYKKGGQIICLIK